jgi:hypothetical protein
MKLPIATLITLLENEMTEEKCDALALALSSFVSSKGGVVGKLAGGIVYGAIDVLLRISGSSIIAPIAVSPIRSLNGFRSKEQRTSFSRLSLLT